MVKKLFTPGPTHVGDEILQAQAAPMIGHRTKEYSDLQGVGTPKLQKLLYTKQRVYIFSSASTGVGGERYLSITVTKIANTRGITAGDLNQELGRRGALISNGDAELKDKCFRIAHMGDLTMDDMQWLLAQINDILGLSIKHQNKGRLS